MDGMPLDKTGLRILTESECYALLESMPIGRVVYSDRALPVIVPVNFGLAGADIVIRTGRRSGLATHAVGHVIAFEVDEIDRQTRSGWSVVLTGFARLVEDPYEVRLLDELKLRPWAPAATERYVRLRPDLVTGRRIASEPSFADADAGPEAYVD